jgi:2-oxoglutarate dehydrogenase complex dehydrogenase (E1) component-like enzyme
MTVGIAAINDAFDDPGVVISADRMVTVGNQGGVEYEDSEAKIDTFVNNDAVSAVAVGAGASTYIDEILNKCNSYIHNADDQPTTISGAMQYCLTAYKENVKETVNNQVLSPLGYHISDLKDDDTRIPSEVQRAIVEQVADIRNTTAESVKIIVAGVGQDGAGIFQLAGNDFNTFTEIGYSVIGSGSDSARLTFTRRGYDRSCSELESMFTVLEAKSQAEERQGVGQEMDLLSVKQGTVTRYDQEQKESLREQLGRIDQAEEDARQRVMNEWNNSSS